MPNFDVLVEEQGRSIRTTVYVYDADNANDALELHEQGAEPIWAWVDSDDFLDEISETVVDVRLSEDQDA